MLARFFFPLADFALHNFPLSASLPKVSPPALSMFLSIKNSRSGFPSEFWPYVFLISSLLQAQKVDTKGLQAVLVHIQGHHNFLLQE